VSSLPPPKRASIMCVLAARARAAELNLLVRYFDWVDDAGWQRSLRPFVQAQIPMWANALCCCLLDPEVVMWNFRERMRASVMEGLPAEVRGGW
jgi:hypothetical protein